MPIRWIISPVIETLNDDGTRSYAPKVAYAQDPGRPGRVYSQSSIIEPGIPWCLSFVRGVDMSGLDADATFINLFEAGADYEDEQNFLAQTPRQMGWNQGRLNRILNRLSSRGVNTAGLTLDSPLYEFLLRLGQRVWPSWTTTKGTWAGRS